MKAHALLLNAAAALQGFLDDHKGVMTPESVRLMKHEIAAVKRASRQPMFTRDELELMSTGLGFWYSDYNSCPKEVNALMDKLKPYIEAKRKAKRRKVS